MRLLGRRERFASWKRRGRKELGRLGCFVDCRARMAAVEEVLVIITVIVVVAVVVGVVVVLVSAKENYSREDPPGIK